MYLRYVQTHNNDWGIKLFLILFEQTVGRFFLWVPGGVDSFTPS